MSSSRVERARAFLADVRRRLAGTRGRGKRLRGLIALLAPYRGRVIAMFAALLAGTAAALAPPPLAKLAPAGGGNAHSPATSASSGLRVRKTWSGRPFSTISR